MVEEDEPQTKENQHTARKHKVYKQWYVLNTC